MASSLNRVLFAEEWHGGNDDWFTMIASDTTHRDLLFVTSGRATLDGYYTSVDGGNTTSRDPVNGATVRANFTNAADFGRAWDFPSEWSPMADLVTAGKLSVLCGVGRFDERGDGAMIAAGTRAIPDLQGSHQHASQYNNTMDPFDGLPGALGYALEQQVGAATLQALSFDHSGKIAGGEALQAFKTGHKGDAVSPAPPSAPELDNEGRALVEASATPTGLSPAFDSLFALDRRSLAITNDYAAIKALPWTDAAGVEIDQVTIDGYRALFTADRYGDVCWACLDFVARLPSTDDKKYVISRPKGGFDTHGEQGSQHVLLLAGVAQNWSAHQTVVEALGIDGNTGLFSFSDFNRSLKTNGSGTDHAWGTSWYLMGGVFAGGKIFGTPYVPHVGDEDAGETLHQFEPMVAHPKGKMYPHVETSEALAGIAKAALGLTDAEIAASHLGAQMAKFAGTAVDFTAA